MAQYRSRYFSVLLLLVVAVFICSLCARNIQAVPAPQAGTGDNSVTPAEKAQGWISLFDGRTMTGWQPVGDAPWMVDNGTLSVTIVPPVHGDLMTTATYTDFELKVEFWTEKKNSNSGVYLRCTPSAGGKWTWYEVNISDASDAFPTGSLVGVQSTLPDFRADTSGKWNTMEMTAEGTHFIVKLNGRTTVDGHDSKLTSGPIGLQGGGSGLLRFRNIKVRPITGGHSS
jgi:hypothetical protein